MVLSPRVALGVEQDAAGPVPQTWAWREGCEGPGGLQVCGCSAHSSGWRSSFPGGPTSACPVQPGGVRAALAREVRIFGGGTAGGTEGLLSALASQPVSSSPFACGQMIILPNPAAEAETDPRRAGSVFTAAFLLQVPCGSRVLRALSLAGFSWADSAPASSI